MIKSFRLCKDFSTINIGIQFDWGIIKDEFVITLNLTFWSLELVLNR